MPFSVPVRGVECISGFFIPASYDQWVAVPVRGVECISKYAQNCDRKLMQDALLRCTYPSIDAKRFQVYAKKLYKQHKNLGLNFT